MARISISRVMRLRLKASMREQFWHDKNKMRKVVAN